MINFLIKIKMWTSFIEFNSLILLYGSIKN